VLVVRGSGTCCFQAATADTRHIGHHIARPAGTKAETVFVLTLCLYFLAPGIDDNGTSAGLAKSAFCRPKVQTHCEHLHWFRLGSSPGPGHANIESVMIVSTSDFRLL
jgi:hypothetical protein